MYRNDLICSWTVIATDDTKVLLEVIDLGMEDGYDFLMIGNGLDPGESLSVITSLTGSVKIRTLTSSGHGMWLTIATDGTTTGRGFHINMRRIQHTQGRFTLCFIQGVPEKTLHLYHPQF